MQNLEINSIFSSSINPTTLLIALGIGVIPSLIWLLFWLREDREWPEPRGLLFLTFLAGMFAVIFVLPVQQWIATLPLQGDYLVILWAFSEEVLKFLAVFIIAMRTGQLDEPIDFPIYCITGALGFAALENSLYLIHPVLVQDTIAGLLTGNLRFMGSTLLHSVATGIVGIMLGLAFGQKKGVLFIATIFGLLIGTALHSVFNFFIIKDNGGNFFSVFAIIWAVTVVVLLLFEKLRRMSQIIDEKKTVQPIIS